MKERKKRSNLKKIFPLRLKEAMAFRDINQKDLAKITGFSQSNISHYAKGHREPAISNLLTLSEALQVTTDYLCGNYFNEDRMTKNEGEFFHKLKKLNSYHLKIIYDFLDLLVERQGKR